MPRKKVKINVKKLTKTAEIPNKANPTDAAFDIYADQSVKIAGRGGRLAVSTGIALEIEDKYYVQLRERSGFSLESAVFLKGGVIDSGYRGEIKVILQNNSEFPVDIEKGQKIAQFTIHRVENVALKEIEEFEDADTDRGEDGFGSTGK
jgi:deoxyuridine 5'-triphosphate nucleotidohydrolase